MSLTYGFYNSINSDRKYNAEQLSSLFEGIIKDGVFMSIGDCLIAECSSGLTVNVGTGRAWFNQTWINNDAKLSLTMDQAETILNRIDTIVLEVNKDNAVRASTIKVVKGTPSTLAVPPTLLSSELVNQHPLADVFVGANMTSLSQDSITNRVGTSDCPFVTGILQTVNIDALLKQWDSEFNTWITGLKNVLNEDEAGNLLNLINQQKASNEYQLAGGTANAITLTIPDPVSDGMPINFMANSNNNSAATTINGIPFYKYGLTGAPKLVSGRAYSGWYSSLYECFFVKASAEGNAYVEQVLAGRTFSNEDDVGIVGTATIDTLGGLQWRSGNQQNSSDSYYFTHADGSTVAMNYVHVTGLPFRPRRIFIFATSGAEGTIYQNNFPFNANYPTGVIWNFGGLGGGIVTTARTHNFKLDGSSAFISDGVFRLPVTKGSITYNWLATT